MSNLVSQLADTMKSFGVHSAYGDPVEIDGETIIPVAMVYGGFGGGSEAESGEKGKGSPGIGGGGGGGVMPIGAYVKGPEGVCFRPNTIAFLVVSIPVLFIGGRALARVIRALKK